MAHTRTFVSAVVLALLTSCSFVRFERGPYAIRDLEVVYSDQEDVTFLSWRLRKDARPDKVSFELATSNEQWTAIELEDAPFPAEPYECGEFWCFQYQVDGEYTVPAQQTSPVRSVHEDEGVFMGPYERQRRVRTTFSVAPIALGHNDAIASNRFDWFEDAEVPLERQYEWQFTRREGNECAAPSERWAPLTEPIVVDRVWTELAVADDGICFNARPVRTDTDGVVHTAVLFPSAETSWELQEYVPPRLNTPIVWGIMLDLEIPSESRCTRVKDDLIRMIETSIEARGVSRKLGIYTPLDSESGEELGGCDQAAVRDYPFEKMLQDAEAAKVEFAPVDVRVLWIFVNNIELPPPERVVEQLALLGLLTGGDFDADLGGRPVPEEVKDELPPELGGIEGLPEFHTWAIGSNLFMQLVPWNQTTGWRPVEDETFGADIKAVTKRVLPFATMRHEPSTEVEIRLPPGVDTRPEAFRVCEVTPPVPVAVGNEAGAAQFGVGDVVTWPEFDDEQPYYIAELRPQYLVPRADYVRQNVGVVVEVCTAFCDGPFRSRGGEDWAAWSSSRVCQWQQ